MPASSLKKLPAAARRTQPAEIRHGAEDGIRGFTKCPYEYDHLAGSKEKNGKLLPMLSGLIQSNLIYWIGRHTWGNPKRPEWARLSITALAKLCGDAERKTIAVALRDLQQRGIIAWPERAGCTANSPKMYRLCPENWKAAPPYEAPVDEDLLALARAVEDGWTEAEPEAAENEPAEASEPAEVAPGKLSRPQPLAISVKGSDEPVRIRIVYHADCDEPLTFRARAGRNGRLQISASTNHTANRSSGGTKEQTGEQEAKRCSRAQPHAFAHCSPVGEANKDFQEFASYINRRVLELWGTSIDSEFARSIFQALNGAPLASLQAAVNVRLPDAKAARSHKPGLLLNLAAQAARAHSVLIETEKQDARAVVSHYDPPRLTGEEREYLEKKFAAQEAEEEQERQARHGRAR